MRLWSLNPGYLDAKGLVALWREALLAKNVLLGNTKGYVHHPQLKRFKEAENPVSSIDYYLGCVYEEALNRGYNFNSSKFKCGNNVSHIKVTDEQLKYEFEHLLQKLKIRDYPKYLLLKNVKEIDAHPLFKVVKGKIEDWEKRYNF